MTDVDELAIKLKEACLAVDAALQPEAYNRGEYPAAEKKFTEASRLHKLRAILTDRDALKARVEELNASLWETLAVATRNEEGDFADRARAVLTAKET